MASNVAKSDDENGKEESHTIKRRDEAQRAAALQILKSHEVPLQQALNLFPEIDDFFSSSHPPNLDGPGNAQESFLLSLRNRDVIQRVKNGFHVSVAIGGTPLSGKSQLINCLLNATVIPLTIDGVGSNHFFVISNSSIQESYVKRQTIQQFISNSTEHIQSVPAMNKSFADLTHIVRTMVDSLPRTSTTQWEVIDIKFPFTVLNSQFTLVELPTCPVNAVPLAIEEWKRFVHYINPSGIVFCYKNSTFDAQELESFNFYLGMTPTGDVGQNVDYFFVNNFASYDSFHNSRSTGSTDQDESSDAASRFAKLKARKLAWNFSGELLPLGSYQSTGRFACICTQDWSNYRTSSVAFRATQKAHFISGRVFNISKLLWSWCVHLHHTRLAIAYNIIDQACSNFYDCVDSEEQAHCVLSQHLNAIEGLDELFQVLRSLIQRKVNEIPSKVDELVQDQTRRERLQELIKNDLFHTSYDGTNRFTNQTNAMSEFKNLISPLLAEEYINPVVRTLQLDISQTLVTKIESFLAKFQLNSLMQRALCNALRPDSMIRTQLINLSGSYGAMVSLFVDKIMSTGGWAGPLFLISSPVFAALTLGGLVATAATQISKLLNTIDDDWRRDSLNYFIDKLSSCINPMILNSTVDTFFNEISSQITEELNLQKKLEVEFTNQLIRRKDTIFQLRTRICRIETYCWINEMQQNSIYKAPVIQECIRAGGVGRIYAGTFNGKPCVIKCALDSNDATERMFFEEMHYYRMIMKHLPFLDPSLGDHVCKPFGVFRKPSSDFNDIKAWCLILPQYEGSIHQWYVNQSAQTGFASAKQVESILLQTLNGIYALHSLGITHRDIKPANLLFNTLPSGGLHVVVADFGTCTRSRNPRTDIGSPLFKAPEVSLAGTQYNYSDSVDLYSFGTGAQHIIELLGPDWLRSNADNPNLKVIRSCTSATAADRPNLIDLINSIRMLFMSSN